MAQQITDTILMIRPVAFHTNSETAVNNYFQHESRYSESHDQAFALREFDELVRVFRANDIEVIVIEDTPIPHTPDSIFPNNWISFHANGAILTYPMYARNRRLERREDIIDQLKHSFQVNSCQSLDAWERPGFFLEGTGSLILDREHKVAYAALSERTSRRVIEDFEGRTGYRTIMFHARQTVGEERLPIYHTNVMMAVGEGFAVVCLDTLDNLQERRMLEDSLRENNKEVIAITEKQMHQFAGNVLHVTNPRGDRFIAMSSAAFDSYTDKQKAQLSQHGKLIYSPIPTIENLGGGGVRCMMAEVFLPRLDRVQQAI